MGGVPRHRHARLTRRGPSPPRGARAGRHLRPPLHVGHHRRAEGRGDDPRPDPAGGIGLGGDDRAQRRRPLPDGQPVLPHVRVEGRDPRLDRGGGDDVPRARVRRRPGAGPGGVGRHHGVPRRADDLPVAARPPRPGRPRPVEPAGGGDRRRRHPGAPDRAHPRGAALLPRGHRVRPERGRHRLRHHPRRRRRDRGHHRGPGPPRLRDPDRRRRPRPPHGRGRRGRPPRAVGDGRLPRRPRRHRRLAVSGRLAAHRRPRRARRARQPAHRRPQQGHVHRGRLQRLPRGDRERPPPPPRRAAGRGDRHPRRAPRRGRHGLRGHALGRPGRRTRDPGVVQGPDGQLQGPARHRAHRPSCR